MDAGDGVKRLVLQAVDPELLEAVVGPRLAPAWVKPLRAQYARFKQAYPADWVDVENVWRKQRARMAVQGCTAPRGSRTASSRPPGLSRRARRPRRPGRPTRRSSSSPGTTARESPAAEPSHRLPAGASHTLSCSMNL